jgi:hypothetical protein
LRFEKAITCVPGTEQVVAMGKNEYFGKEASRRHLIYTWRRHFLLQKGTRRKPVVAINLVFWIGLGLIESMRWIRDLL